MQQVCAYFLQLISLSYPVYEEVQWVSLEAKRSSTGEGQWP